MRKRRRKSLPDTWSRPRSHPKRVRQQRVYSRGDAATTHAAACTTDTTATAGAMATAGCAPRCRDRRTPESTTQRRRSADGQRGSARRGRGVIVGAKSCASTSTATSTARASRSSGAREARAVAGAACWALYACPDAGRRVSAGRRFGHLARAASSRMTPRRARPLDGTECCLAVWKEIDWICPTVNGRSIRESGSGRSSGRTRSAVALGSFTDLSSVGAGNLCALGQRQQPLEPCTLCQRGGVSARGAQCGRNP